MLTTTKMADKVIARMIEILEGEGHWCQCELYADAQGRRVSRHNPNRTSACLEGALWLMT